MTMGYLYRQARLFDDVLYPLPDDMAVGRVGDDYPEAEFGEKGFPEGKELVKE